MGLLGRLGDVFTRRPGRAQRCSVVIHINPPRSEELEAALRDLIQHHRRLR
jgi:hypothetical protein